MIALICGKREEGKSTRGLSLAYEWSQRVLIFDSRRQFDLPNASIAFSPDTLADTLETACGPVVYQPETGDDEQEIIAVAEMVRAMGEEHWPERRFTFLIDEAGFVAGTGDGVKSLKKMIRSLRLDTVRLLFLAHRPSEIHPSFRGLITDLYCFILTDPCDLDWLRRAGIELEVIETIRALPPHHHVHVKVGTRQAPEVFSEPDKWYVPFQEFESCRT